MENPYMLYNLFGLKFIMMQWKTFFVDNREEIGAYICYQRQKRERGSETIYAENVRMCTSALMGAKKCKGG